MLAETFGNVMKTDHPIVKRNKQVVELRFASVLVKMVRWLLIPQ